VQVPLVSRLSLIDEHIPSSSNIELNSSVTLHHTNLQTQSSQMKNEAKSVGFGSRLISEHQHGAVSPHRRRNTVDHVRIPTYQGSSLGSFEKRII
jgi:hypothetical protein